jgi:peptidoglycan/xylan/chitin deacetylase (PgdA/CDA1 family)
MKGFTVLLYHRVHPKFGVHPKTFKKQMEFLKKYFNVLTIKDLNKPKFPSVVITFDDGFYDFFLYAYPILKNLNLPSILFVSPERILNSDLVREDKSIADISTQKAFKKSFLEKDNSAFLSWGELKKISDIVDVQSHALTHRAAIGEGKPYSPPEDWRVYSLNSYYSIKPGTPLTSILVTDLNEARKELTQSRQILERKLNKEVNAIAWPWGIYNETVVKIALESGYDYCFTTERGWNRKNLCHIKRLAVGEKKDFSWFLTRTLLYAF